MTKRKPKGGSKQTLQRMRERSVGIRSLNNKGRTGFQDALESSPIDRKRKAKTARGK